MHDEARTPYLGAVLRGERPTAEQWQEHLIEFYRTIDDNAAYSIHVFDQDSDSYGRLARATGGASKEILDVGCGDGLLTEALERANPMAHITGIDISEAELSRMKQRVPRATGICGDVGSMPFEGGTFDFVASHLVLMHVPDLDRTLAEIRRVLLPQGVFAFAIVCEGNASSNAWWPFEVAVRAIREFAPEFRPASFQDSRLVNEVELEALLRRHRFEGTVAVDNYEVSEHLLPDVLLGLVDRSYHVALLPEQMRVAVAAALRLESEKRLNADGTVQFGIDMRLVTVRVGKTDYIDP